MSCEPQHGSDTRAARAAGAQAAGPSVEVLGIDARLFDGPRLRARLRGASLRVSARRFGIFSIGPLGEATLTDASLDVFLQGAERRAIAGIFDPAGGHGVLPWLEGSGRPITKVVVRGFAARVFPARTDEPAVRLRARWAESGGTRGELELSNVELERPSGDLVIRAPRCSWILDRMRFRFPAGFTASTAGGLTRHPRAMLDLELREVPEL